MATLSVSHAVLDYPTRPYRLSPCDSVNQRIGTGLTISLRYGETPLFRISHPSGHPTLGLSESVLRSLFASPKFLSELG